MKIISGGQIGADIAALQFAKGAGIETGGWMPKDFLTLDGPHPEYAELYGMVETHDGGYPARTRMNVANSDVTIRFATNFMSYGERATAREIRKLMRPSLDILIDPSEISKPYPDVDYVAHWLDIYEPKIINIAGNAKKDIEVTVRLFLDQLWRLGCLK